MLANIRSFELSNIWKSANIRRSNISILKKTDISEHLNMNIRRLVTSAYNNEVFLCYGNWTRPMTHDQSLIGLRVAGFNFYMRLVLNSEDDLHSRISNRKTIWQKLEFSGYGPQAFHNKIIFNYFFFKLKTYKLN